VPRLFKHSGKIRNKQMSKRETEKLVKEVWKERMADPGEWRRMLARCCHPAMHAAAQRGRTARPSRMLCV
jgi:hypothetical protein